MEVGNELYVYGTSSLNSNLFLRLSCLNQDVVVVVVVVVVAAAAVAADAAVAFVGYFNKYFAFQISRALTSSGIQYNIPL